jgi:UDP-N-acetylmuramate dehydrogenase
MHHDLQIEHDVALRPHTTLQVGGAARLFVQARSRQVLQQALWWAKKQRLPTFLLGGGSNVVVADRGFNGLVIKLSLPGIAQQRTPTGALLCCGAGVDWDTLVAQACAEDLAGLECLSGIPGTVGAAPVQNIGAYGQELSQTLQAVHVIERRSGQLHILPQAALGLRYRQSHFKSLWAQRFAIVQVDLELVRGAAGCTAYSEVQHYLGQPQGSVAQVRQAVLALRARKSLLLRPHLENGRSVGSFFVNPTVPCAALPGLIGALGEGLPNFVQPGDTHAKLSAAWLIERAGFARGCIQGNVGLSTAHALCLVNRGEATAQEVVTFAATVAAAVRRLCGVVLQPEPQFVGFAPGELPPCFSPS